MWPSRDSSDTQESGPVGHPRYPGGVPSPPLEDIDLTGLERTVGATTYARGWVYAQSQRVLGLQVDDVAQALQAVVRGSGGSTYSTTVYLSYSGRTGIRFDEGHCTCPVGHNCKHAVAVALKARNSTTTASTPRRGSLPQSWEQSLGPLLTSEPSDRTAPMGLQVSIPARPALSQWHRTESATRVLARPVAQGKSGAWIKGNLSWNGLNNLNAYGQEHPPEHVRWLQELYALYSARRGQSTHYNGYSPQPTVDLTDFSSQRLWPMLDEAAELGITLMHASKKLGDIARYGSAEFQLDVTRRDTGMLVVTPNIRIDGVSVDVSSVAFIGDEAHGLVAWDGDEPSERPLRFAQFVKPVPAQLQQLALSGQQLEIPEESHSRFLSEYFPVLRHRVAIASSDESFTAPTISAPRLVLHATYGKNHHMKAVWEWSYDIGDTQLRAPLYRSRSGGEYRDREHERAILASLDVPYRELGLTSDGASTGIAAIAELRGIDTVRFTTDVMPLLADHPDVLIEIEGEPAQYRELSDAVHIGLSTAAARGESDWFDLGVTISADGQTVPFADVFAALAHEESHLVLSDGGYFSLEKPELQRLRELIEEARALQDSPDGRLRISRFQAGLWEELAALGVVSRQAKAWRAQVQGLLSIGAVKPTPLPPTLHAELRPYQHQGLDWLVFLWTHRLGGILADDMGLGKTVQSLALICHARETRPTDAPFLIVAPTSVVPNWASECARFAPDLRVVAVTDTLRRRGQPLEELLLGADIIITSYTLFRLDFDSYSGAEWSALIMDEAQFAKNHQSKLYQCARRLETPFKLAITGTPMENNLMELWSLLSITAPGLFTNPTHFGDYYRKPIEKQGDTELLAQLRRRIKPLVLRRTKEQVAGDLPAKQEQVLEVELNPKHRKIYQTHLQRERQKILGLIDDMNKNRFTILRSLTLLRQLSLDASLVDDEYADVPSAKIEALFEQLDDVIAGGHRALIFSQFTSFLGKVRARLDADGVPYCYLDGRTRKRGDVLDEFKNGSAPVFLISLKAGGFGLNLTEADYCFLLDPWWNPATEAQAVDRTHRIGQTKNVMVYRLIAKDTIEEKVMALKAKKSALFSSVMDEDGMLSSSLSASDIRGLFD